MEEWKIYKEYFKPWNSSNPQHYVIEVSNMGRVRRNGIILEQHGNPNGYKNCCSELVHRMVAQLFVPNPENKPCIDHIDTNKSNNKAENLRWVTYSENMLNPITRKLNSKIQKKAQTGENNGMYGKHHNKNTKKLIANDHYNRKFINNGVQEKFVKIEEIEYYINNGYVLGRLPFSDDHKRKISDYRKTYKKNL